MADSKLITAIGEELECPVCAEYFTDACFLSCMHTFCRSCLQKCDKTYGRGGKSSMGCPLCRKVTHLSKIGVAGLLTDFTSNKLVTRLKEGIEERKNTAGNPQNSAAACQSCQDGTIVSYCLSCCHFICASCQSLHSKLGAMRTHEVVPLKELRKGNVTVVRAEKPQFCSVHKLDTVCFCYTCQKYHCDLCCSLDRQRAGHNCTEPSHNVDGEPVAKKKKEAVIKSVEKLTNKRISITEQQTRVKRLRATVKRHFGAMADQLKSNHALRLNKITRVLKEKHDDLAKEITEGQELVLSKIASVDGNLGHSESRALEAKAIGDNAVTDGQHAEIAFINEYLDSVVSSLNEDDSAEKMLTQIEKYAEKVTLTPVPADRDVEALASLGHVFHPDVWDEITVSGLSFDLSQLAAIQFDSSLGSFLVSTVSTGSIYSIDLQGKSDHICYLPVDSKVQDMAISRDGSSKYLLFQDNRIRVFKQHKWDRYTGVIEIPGKKFESCLSSVAVSEQDVVVVGDQESQTVVGCSSHAFKKMTDISPVQMTFTSSGDLAVVCRNIGHVDAAKASRWNRSGVVVRIFGGDERRENTITQNNWQAAAVSSHHKKETSPGLFFAFGVYVLENGSQLASLAEYDTFGARKEIIFDDKELPLDLENGVQPILAVDHEGNTIIVFTGNKLYLFRRRVFDML